MKNRSLSIVLCACAVLICTVMATPTLAADTATDRATERTYTGVVTDISLGSRTIVLQHEAADEPTTYVFNKETIFTDAAGDTIPYETAKDALVTLHATSEGDRVTVHRVVVSKPATLDAR